MAKMSRRDFLRSGIVLASAGAFMPPFFARAAAAPSPDQAKLRTLVVVQLAGGNDGLNTVIPFTDSRYRQLRPNLGIAPETIVDLNGTLGLHPSLKPLKELWDAGQLAIVENVGYDHPSLSHFQAMDIWERADPTLKRRDGWLSTVVDGTGDKSGFRGLSVTSSLTPVFASPPVPPPALTNPGAYQLQPDPRYQTGKAARDEALNRLYSSYADPAPYAAALQSVSGTTRESVKTLRDAVSAHQASVSYPKGPLADGLKLLAAMIAKDTGLRAGYVVLGGFDTHANQADRHSQLLQTLAAAVSAFQADIAAAGKADEVLLMTWSEFGRRAAENGNRGTDHGTAAPVLLVGKGIRGGIYGDPPDLANLDSGNLRFQTDFRSLYATILDGWLQVDPASILGADFPRVPFL